MGWNMGCRGCKKYGAEYGVMSCIKYGVIYGAPLAKRLLYLFGKVWGKTWGRALH